MPKMVVTHRVVDVDNWLKDNTERAETITARGCTNVVDYTRSPALDSRDRGPRRLHHQV